MKKISLAVIHGGVSGEHEVSLLSAAAVMANLNAKKYQITPIKIDKGGQTVLDLAALKKFDLVFPLIHGTGGEDGALQGLLEFNGIPYVGSGVLGSALGMDKVVQKKILQQAGLPVTPYLSYKKSDWLIRSKQMMAEIGRQLGFPCFVKPANSGSSVGISKAHHRRELRAGLDEAFLYDSKIIVERAVPSCREIECGVIGNDAPVASVLGEIISANEFYDYEAKYLSDKSTAVVPAELSKSLEKKLRDFAVRTFVALEASGLARVDFLLSRETNEVFVNEINTIPGFTSHSMFPDLWKASGLPFGKLLDRLIELALERAKAQRGLKRSYVPKKV